MNPGKIADDLLARFSLTDEGTREASTYSGCMRALFTEQSIGADLWIALAWCTGILIAAYALAMNTYRRKTS
jgi:hypothetical protein